MSTALAPSSCMSMISRQAMTGRPPVSPIRSGSPTRTTGTPSESAACLAPATISPGALSPPMASTAIGSRPKVGASADVHSRSRRPPARTTRSSDTRREAAWPGGTAGRCSGREPTSVQFEARRLRPWPWRSSSWGRPCVAGSFRTRLPCHRPHVRRGAAGLRPFRAACARRTLDPAFGDRRTSSASHRGRARLAPAGPSLRLAPQLGHSPGTPIGTGAPGAAPAARRHARAARGPPRHRRGGRSPRRRPRRCRAHDTASRSVPDAGARHRRHAPDHAPSPSRSPIPRPGPPRARRRPTGSPLRVRGCAEQSSARWGPGAVVPPRSPRRAGAGPRVTTKGWAGHGHGQLPPWSKKPR